MEPTSGLEPLTCGRLAPPGSVWGSRRLRGSGGAWVDGADERTRTADLLITSELLYQLSYVGLWGQKGLPVGFSGRDQLSFRLRGSPSLWGCLLLATGWEPPL